MTDRPRRVVVPCPGCGTEWTIPVPEVLDAVNDEPCACGVTVWVAGDETVGACGPGPVRAEAVAAARDDHPPRPIGDVVREVLGR